MRVHFEAIFGQNASRVTRNSHSLLWQTPSLVFNRVIGSHPVHGNNVHIGCCLPNLRAWETGAFVILGTFGTLTVLDNKFKMLKSKY